MTCASWIYTLPTLTNLGNVPDYPLTETVTIGTDYATPLITVPYTQKDYSTGYSDGFFFSDPEPMNCAYASAAIVIKQIPASVISSLNASASSGGDAYGGVYGYQVGVKWQLRWSGYRMSLALICTSNFQGTVFVPLPRTITFQIDWSLSLNAIAISESGGLIDGNTHTMAGTYTDTNADPLSQISNSYVRRDSSVAAEMGSVFGNLSIITSGEIITPPPPPPTPPPPTPPPSDSSSTSSGGWGMG